MLKHTDTNMLVEAIILIYVESYMKSFHYSINTTINRNLPPQRGRPEFLHKAMNQGPQCMAKEC